MRIEAFSVALFFAFTVATPTFAAKLEVTEFQYSADTEYVVLKNTSDKKLNLQNWRIADASVHTLVFPNVTLKPNQKIKIFTKEGSNKLNATLVKVYWRNNWAVWNNDHDTLKVKNKNGKTVLTYRY